MYNIKYEAKVENDLKKIDQSLRIQIFKKIEKISINPEIWDNLTWNLVWYKKVYVNSKKIRIVYKIIDDKIEILIIVIGKRENEKVYKDAFKRINK